MSQKNHKGASAREYGRLSFDPGVLLQRAMTIILCLLFAGLLFAGPGALGQTKPNAYQVEAAYLYNFGRFVEWPARGATAQGSSFTICVLGEDPFGHQWEIGKRDTRNEGSSKG